MNRNNYRSFQVRSFIYLMISLLSIVDTPHILKEGFKFLSLDLCQTWHGISTSCWVLVMKAGGTKWGTGRSILLHPQSDRTLSSVPIFTHSERKIFTPFPNILWASSTLLPQVE